MKNMLYTLTAAICAAICAALLSEGYSLIISAGVAVAYGLACLLLIRIRME